MKASISFSELQGIIKEKAGQAFSFSPVDRRTFRVTYPLNLGFIKKDISANLIVKEMNGSDLLLQLSAGPASDMMLNTILNLAGNKIPEGLLEKHPDSHVLLHLDQVEQLKSVFEKISVSDVHVLDDGLEVEGTLR